MSTPQQPEPSATPRTKLAIASFNEQCDIAVSSYEMAELERALTAAETELRATKAEIAREREDMRLRCADYDYQHETATALRAELASERAAGARYREALHKIAFEPIGPSDATHKEVLDMIEEIARQALAAPTQAGKVGP